jgi:hypothetical protein
VPDEITLSRACRALALIPCQMSFWSCLKLRSFLRFAIQLLLLLFRPVIALGFAMPAKCD